MSELPEAWTQICFAEACSKISDGTHHSPKVQHTEPGPNRFKYITSKNIRPWGMDLDDLTYVDERVHREIFSRCNPEYGDVLLTKDGVNTGVVAINTLNEEFSLLSSVALLKVRKELVEPKFLKHYITSPDGSRALLGSMSGTAIRRIILRQINEATLVLPPLAEQKRILAKIEELFSELDAGEESLRRARRQLGVYRQSLLKQAFEGKLTAPWREQHPDLLESPDQLLARIQTERQARYQQQLKEWEKSGGGRGKHTKPDAAKPISENEVETLAELPNRWTWTYLSNVGDLGRGKSKHRPRNAPELFGGKYPFIQTGEVKAATKVVKEYTETYSDFGLAQSKLWPAGTLCITIAANIAETAFLGFDACFPDSVVGFVPMSALVFDEYVELFIRSARSRIEEFAPATAQKNINLTTLENLVIPLCSLPEQQEIVRLLDEQFEVIEQNEREIDAALKRSEALRQSILKKAFTGQLVPQDPTDEPASALLERIRRDRASAGKTTMKKAARGRNKKASSAGTADNA